jgi:hypothetical protein
LCPISRRQEAAHPGAPGGAAAPALADDSVPTPTPTCDTAALAATVTTASAAARTAQKAFTDHARGSAHQQADRLRAQEARKAREAAKAAREASKVAASEARQEANEAAAVRRASDRDLRDDVEAERAML